MSMSWPSYVPALMRSNWTCGLGQPRADVRDEVADRPVRVAVVARAHALIGRQRPDQPDELVPARAFGLDLGGVRVVGRQSVSVTRDGHGVTRELALERQAGVLPVEQPARVAPHVAVAAADEIAVEGDAREAIDVRAIDDDLVVRARPRRTARRACRSGASPGCAWRRTPSG